MVAMQRDGTDDQGTIVSNPSTALFHRATHLLLAKDMPGSIALFVHYRDYRNPQAAQDLLGGGLVRP